MDQRAPGGHAAVDTFAWEADTAHWVGAVVQMTVHRAGRDVAASRAVERRQASRFQLAIPVTFEQGAGRTRDVSVAGAFIETPQPEKVGASIQFTLLFEHFDTTGPVPLRCGGEVVRTEPRGPVQGMAVAITWYAFEPTRLDEHGRQRLGPSRRPARSVALGRRQAGSRSDGS
jgi:PilZ domain-containing protein